MANPNQRHFLKLGDLSKTELETLFSRSIQLKKDRRAGIQHSTLRGRTLGLVFEKASTRTKLSFEAAMKGLGGSTITLQAAESQIARGEPVRDTARVASSYVDVLMYRTFGDDRLEEFARYSCVPVINGLSDGAHPVQLLADLMTIIEHKGGLTGRRVAWIGDGATNMALSWIEAALILAFTSRSVRRRATGRRSRSPRAPRISGSLRRLRRLSKVPMWSRLMSGPAWGRRMRGLHASRRSPATASIRHS